MHTNISWINFITLTVLNNVMMNGIKYIAFWSDEYPKHKQYILNILSGLIGQQLTTNRQSLKGTFVNFDNSFIFFSKVNKNDKFLKFQDDEITIVLKMNNEIVTDIFCSDWTKISNYYLGTFSFKLDNRFLCLLSQLNDINYQHISFSDEIKFFKLLNFKRSVRLFKKSNCKNDVIYSYGECSL